MNSTTKLNNHSKLLTWEGPQIPPLKSTAMNEQDIKQNRRRGWYPNTYHRKG